MQVQGISGKMSDLKLIIVAILAFAFIASGQRRQVVKDAGASGAEDMDEEAMEMLNKMFDEIVSTEEDSEHTSETTSGGEATEEETRSLGTSLQGKHKFQNREKHLKTLQREERLRRSLYRKRGLKEWFCDKLLDSSEESSSSEERGKWGVRNKLWKTLCIPGPVSSSSSSSEEWRPPNHG
ncbi:uncharacterized protein LOC118414839 [Branchiostoma floridae]|uniref:Uncharacterized protein LOC118414839 n=1 Tax=Branchiostoma floridae TaxID=7739 RepID=A0A9J7L3W3_BRAFL|nr:uncharacterized protein LOC118414839 [Branchiostoma floridae]